MPIGAGFGTPNNRNLQKFGVEAVRRRLQGLQDSRSRIGILSRGKNIYNGTSYAAHSGGGPQYGRPVGSRDVSPTRSSINRRLAKRGISSPLRYG